VETFSLLIAHSRKRRGTPPILRCMLNLFPNHAVRFTNFSVCEIGVSYII
jgi:hypothetical protein